MENALAFVRRFRRTTLSRDRMLFVDTGLGELVTSLESRRVLYASTIVKPLPYFLPILAVLVASIPLRRPVRHLSRGGPRSRETGYKLAY